MSSHTFESVCKHFGEKTQIVAGSIIVNVEGKNVEVGHMDNATGVFSLTANGQTLLEDAPSKKAKVKPEAQPVETTTPTVDLGLQALGK